MSLGIGKEEPEPRKEEEGGPEMAETWPGSPERVRADKAQGGQGCNEACAGAKWQVSDSL